MLASPWDGVYATEIRSARRYGRHSHATFGFGVVADGAHRFRESLIAAHEAAARQRLADAGPESELPEIQAWRRGFARMGLKPTQYRCASESLLRRLRKEGTMPRIHPMIDLCNAISMAFAVPVAVLDRRASRARCRCGTPIAQGLRDAWSVDARTQLLSADQPVFGFP